MNAEPRPSYDGQDAYLTEKQAAELTGLSCAWFQRARWSGDGPQFVRVNRAVRYRRSVLTEWMDSRTKSSTSDK